ncbi:MAG: hypothetical protein FJX72_02565 [Armatimonadetes bacterium]|nr:hypothetical protein [Armatimonadota bacterium]
MSLLASPPSPPPLPFRSAVWIAPQAGQIPAHGTPLFRREFRLDGQPRKGVLRIVGLGDYDVTVNSRRVAPTGINQPWSQYEKTLYWTEFDVTKLLRTGVNCIGVQLGASFWHNPNPPAGRYNKDGPQRVSPEPFLLCAELEMSAQDGKPTRVGTDGTWRAHAGPVVFSHVFAGEDYDARQTMPGWDRAGFDDREWTVARVAGAPSGRLLRRDFAGVASFRSDKPTEMRTAPNGAILCSFPQNMSAHLRVKLDGGKPGDRVTFRCCEHRDGEGRPTGGYVVDCGIVTDGKKVDRRWSHFYLGMQFAEVRGAVLPGSPNPDNLPTLRAMELIHVRCSLPETGSFTSSSDLLNHTHALVDWAVRSNMSWVMTDCPHREKLGWLECAYLLAPTFMYRYEGRDWFAKIARDIRDAQEPNGMVRTVAPSYPAGRFPGAFDWTVEWGAAVVMVPWIHYEWFGDAASLRDSLESMRRFTDYVGTLAKDHIAPQGLGDWYDYGHGHGPGPSRFTPTDLSSTATWALCALTVARAADAIGDSTTAGRYRQLHREIAASFQRRFRDPATRLLRHLGSPQCANAMAICAEIVPPEDHALLIKDIVADLEKRGWQHTPGDVGHVYFIRALAQAGRSDVLHKVYSRTGLGSYGGILAKGLTSLPETWDAMMDGYQSLNHCMLGHVMEWLYGYVGGIRQAPESVGWRDVVIGPDPGPLTSADVSVRTPRGTVRSSWRVEQGRLILEATLPRGVKGTAVLPSGKTVTLRPGRNVVE